jgi:hypothetical protein
MIVFTWLLSTFGRSALVSAGFYAAVALGGLGAVAWVRHNAAAPYKAEVVALRQAAKQTEEQLKADAAKKLADLDEAEKDKAKLRDIIGTLTTSSCKPTPDQLDRLHKL